MIRPSPWPELDRLARFVRASDSLTDTLAVWAGRGLAVEIVHRVDGACPDPMVADSLALHDGARVLVLSSGDLAIAMGIAARGLGAVPTVVKAWRAPRTEQTTVYAAGVFGALCTLAVVESWTFRTAGFAVYFLVFCSVMTVLVRSGTLRKGVSRSGVAASASATASPAATSSTG